MRVRPIWYKGLHPGTLPWKIAQLDVGQSLLLELTPKTASGIKARVLLAKNSKSLAHMNFETRILNCFDAADPLSMLKVARITRLEDDK